VRGAHSPDQHLPGCSQGRAAAVWAAGAVCRGRRALRILVLVWPVVYAWLYVLYAVCTKVPGYSLTVWPTWALQLLTKFGPTAGHALPERNWDVSRLGPRLLVCCRPSCMVVRLGHRARAAGGLWCRSDDAYCAACLCVVYAVCHFIIWVRAWRFLYCRYRIGCGLPWRLLVVWLHVRCWIAWMHAM
jgi:hypothetical protein